MQLRFLPIPGTDVDLLLSGGLDANGQLPERVYSDGEGNPCRHCLHEIEKDRPMLILSYRPFSSINPYAETGPIFICGDACEVYTDTMNVPDMILSWPNVLLRGYDIDDRIVYGTGQHVKPADIQATALEIFQHKNVAYIHMRSSTNNCYQLRIEKA